MDLKRTLDALEGHLGDKVYLVGDKVSAADVLLA